jgi:hypothetical protein
MTNRRTERRSLRTDETSSAYIAEFWKWGASDLASEPIPQSLAEFIVAKALGIPISGTRSFTQAAKFTTELNCQVEVRSWSFINKKKEIEPSNLSFKIPRINKDLPYQRSFRPGPKAHPDIYVFAMFVHNVPATADPLNPDQWLYYVISANSLRGAKDEVVNIRLLQEVAGRYVSFDKLFGEVRDVSLISDFMRVRSEEGRSALEAAVIIQSKPDDDGLLWAPVQEWDFPPSIWEIREVERRVLGNPQFFRVCKSCGRRTNRSLMHDSLCIICAGPASKFFDATQVGSKVQSKD